MNKLGLMVVLMVAACDGGNGGSGPLSTSSANDVCNDTCEHDVMCNPDGQTLDACVSDCVAELGGGGMRSDAVNAIADCVVAQACTADSSACLTECEPTSAHEAFETKCRAKLAECGGSGSDADSVCETTPDGSGDTGYACLFTPAVMDALAACLDKACTEIDDCYTAVTTQYGLDS